MKRKVLLAAVAALLIGLPQGALADGPDFTIGASASYGYDFNDPDTDGGGPDSSQNVATYSSQEQAESINIDMVQLGMSGDRGALSYAATVSLGDLAALGGDSADGDVALQTMSVTWDTGDMAITAGRFGTPIGYEVLEPWGNANISRSRAWQSQPVNHDGLTLSGTADVVDWMIGVANSFTVSDFSTAGAGGNDNDDEKAIIGSVGLTARGGHDLYLSGIFTEEGDDTDIWMLNAIASGPLEFAGMDIDYAVEGNIRNDDTDSTDTELRMWNIGFYGGTAVSSSTALDVRVDFTKDEGIIAGTDNILATLGTDDYQAVSVSVTGSIELAPGVAARVEFRHDTSNEDIFGDGDEMGDTLNTLQAQLIWHPEAG
jgi:hypothetical protein